MLDLIIRPNRKKEVFKASSKTEILERIEEQMTTQLAPSTRTRRRVDMRVVREKQLEIK